MKLVSIEEAKREFIKYVNKYDLTQEMIEIKKNHSLRVMEVSTELARRENFTEEEIEIATLIGLLHDISRFKQYTEYQTLNDKISFDHGNMSVEILEKDNYLRKFIQTDKYDETIKLAIKNHNKFEIEEGLTEEQNKFCKLIKDADKLDIFYIASEELWENEKEEMENSIINSKIIEVLENEKMVAHKDFEKIEYVDLIFQMLSYLFDVNFKSCYEIIKQERYIDRIVNRFKFKDEYTQMEILKAGKQMKQYILNKLQ